MLDLLYGIILPRKSRMWFCINTRWILDEKIWWILYFKEVSGNNAVRRKRSMKTLLDNVFVNNHCDHVQLMSWGTKILKVRRKYQCFPLLTRKRSSEVLWSKYAKDDVTFRNGMGKLKRSLFIDIATTLTKGDFKPRAWVKYKMHDLV